MFNVLAALYAKSSNDSTMMKVELSQAAAASAQMLAELFEDFEENDGLEFKMLINEVKKEA